MNERHEFIGNFITEHYTIFVDDCEVGTMSSGCWASLESILKAAENSLDEKLLAGKEIFSRYINTDKNQIMFWTHKVKLADLTKDV